MQITSSNWQNPAAHAQQSLSQVRSAQSSHNASNTGMLQPLEQASKTGDRDANERYEGSTDTPHKSSEAALEESMESNMLSLPADDGEFTSLDLTG